MPSLNVRGARLEVAWHGPPDDPTVVLLHEGLGSVSAWRDFPEAVARATGLRVLAYSRAGYGASDPCGIPRPLDYMEREGRDVLPALLDEAGIRSTVLVGHSDGGSIALVGAATDPCDRIRGLVLLAPHVICEDISVRSIDAARREFVNGDLRARLERHHANVDVAFWGWNRAWLDPGFRNFDLTGYLPRIRVPVTAIQGDADPYGTLDQIDRIERGVGGPFERLVLSGVGHAPQRERPDEVVRAIVAMTVSCGP